MDPFLISVAGGAYTVALETGVYADLFAAGPNPFRASLAAPFADAIAPLVPFLPPPDFIFVPGEVFDTTGGSLLCHAAAWVRCGFFHAGVLQDPSPLAWAVVTPVPVPDAFLLLTIGVLSWLAFRWARGART